MTLPPVHEAALRMIADGQAASALAARAADPACYDRYRTAEGLRAHAGAELAPFTALVPGDELAAEMAALDARLAAAMAELEAQGQTRETARAALRSSTGAAGGSHDQA